MEFQTTLKWKTNKEVKVHILQSAEQIAFPYRTSLITTVESVLHIDYVSFIKKGELNSCSMGCKCSLPLTFTMRRRRGATMGGEGEGGLPTAMLLTRSQ